MRDNLPGYEANDYEELKFYLRRLNIHSFLQQRDKYLKNTMTNNYKFMNVIYNFINTLKN